MRAGSSHDALERFFTAISAAAAMRLCQRVSQSTMPVTIIAAVMRISSAQKIFTARSS